MQPVEKSQPMQSADSSKTASPAGSKASTQNIKRILSPFGNCVSEWLIRGHEMEMLGCKTFCAKYAPSTSGDIPKCEEDCAIDLYYRAIERRIW